MIKLIRALGKNSSGQSLLELALITPFLMFALVEIVDIGRYTYLGIEVASSARAGVQYGAQSATTAADTQGMITAAQNDAAHVPGGVTASPTPEYCKCDSGVTCAGTAPLCSAGHNAYYYVSVQSSAAFQPLIRYLGVSSLTVTKTAVLQVQQ